MKNIDNSYREGMSLTEVIIAMLVIGVICAILIPLFKGLFYDKQEFKTKSLKAYQGVNQVLLMNKTQHGQALSPWKNQGIEWVKDNFAAMNVVKYLDESECSNLFVEAEDDVRMCFLNRDGMVYGFVVDGDEQGNVSSNLYVDVNAKKSPNELTTKKSDPRDQWMMKYDQTKGRYEFVLDKPEAPENGPGCEPGTYVINGKCAKCPSGKTYNAYEKKCEDPSNDPTKCEEQGGVMVDGKCMICKTGTKYDSEKKLCLSTGDCSGGETQTGGVCMCEGEQTDDGCMLCPNGYTYNEDQDKCMPGSNTCEEGFTYNSSTGLCEKAKGDCNFDAQCKSCLENDNCNCSTYRCTYPNGGWTEYFCVKPKNISAYQINNEDRKKIKSGSVKLEGSYNNDYTDCRLDGDEYSTYCPNDPSETESWTKRTYGGERGKTRNPSNSTITKETFFCRDEGYSCKGQRKTRYDRDERKNPPGGGAGMTYYEATCYVAAQKRGNVSTHARYHYSDGRWTCSRYNYYSTTKLCSSDPRGGGCNTWTTGHPDYNPISFYYDSTEISTTNSVKPSGIYDAPTWYMYSASNGGVCSSASCGANTASDAPGWGVDDTAPACPSWAK